MSNEDLVYLLAGVLREIGLDQVRVSEETVNQVLRSQDVIYAYQDSDGAIVVGRRPGLVMDHEG